MKNTLGEELNHLETLEPTEISQEVIESFEEYVQIIEKTGEYEGIRKLLFIFGGYSVLTILIFSQMGAGPQWKVDLSHLFSFLPVFFQSLLQGTIYSSLGWIIAQKMMSPIEKKIFSMLWLQQVSIITFLAGSSFWLFGTVSFFNLIAWISGAYIGAHLVTKEQ